MTRATNARIAGFTFLFYIAIGITSTILMSRATSAEGIAAMIAHVAGHELDVRIDILLELLQSVSAFVLAVTLYAITRDVDHELAMLGLTCRIAEGVIGAIGIPKELGMLWLASAATRAHAPDPAAANALGAFLLMPDPNPPIGAIFFAVGSTIFSYLLLRGRMVPVSLARLGVFASALLVVGLPLQLAGFFTGPLTGYQWLPALVFEILLALWLLIKGVALPARRQSA
jgi:hypothetical protein